ncbi:MAG: response regulator [Chitinophagaceae bacterium]
MSIKIGIVDDHQLFLKSLSLLITTFQGVEVVLEALNGKDLQTKLQTESAVIPDIMLVDVVMPQMDGIATATWLKEQFPSIKLVALSMNDNDKSIINMIKAGCSAYLLKETNPADLELAINEIAAKGYYNADISTQRFRELLINPPVSPALTEKEKFFLQLACTDLTYKAIAGKMNLTERAVDAIRENLFGKFQVQSRVGLAMEAVKRNIVDIQ